MKIINDTNITQLQRAVTFLVDWVRVTTDNVIITDNVITADNVITLSPIV